MLKIIKEVLKPFVTYASIAITTRIAIVRMPVDLDHIAIIVQITANNQIVAIVVLSIITDTIAVVNHSILD